MVCLAREVALIVADIPREQEALRALTEDNVAVQILDIWFH